ncbi:MAG: DUF1801 domain-containing protein [Propionibacteriaceae bacterium]|jgi:uncharacterized protein YdhG (YjbR/CyaY superfamily)|nr:DUF1801 domain-containing protein [Propionibacteriaceae bacterium]
MWVCPDCGRSFARRDQHHFCGEIASIDDYIADQDPATQPILAKVRQTIRQAAPQASERIAWKMATFWQGVNLIHFAAAKHHLGIYPGALADIPFSERWAKFTSSKGAIQMPYDQVDYALITDLTLWRVERAAGQTKKPGKRQDD